jgi:uncharacterized membrane protein
MTFHQPVNLFKIYNTGHVLGLIVSFYVPFALSARKTAHISAICLSLTYLTRQFSVMPEQQLITVIDSTLFIKAQLTISLLDSLQTPVAFRDIEIKGKI